jgi:hypothetical protein
MDDNQFDQIVRSLTVPSSRRTAVTGLLGSVLAVLAPVTVIAAGQRQGKVQSEKKRKGNGKGKGCPRGKKKCGKKCIPKGNCCTYVDCTGCRAETCRNGRCQCDPELIMHNGKCGFFIDCKGFGETCTSDVECCGNCVFDVDANESRCGKSIHDCIADRDCLSGPCNGFLCPEANKPYYDLCRGLPGGPNDA